VTYVYCLVRGGRKPPVRRAPGGLPGAGPVRALDAGEGLWLIAADVRDAEYSERAIEAGLQDLTWVSERAVGHERVVERFLTAAALLPMQLFTIFTSDERALEYVKKNRRRIDRILDRVEGHLEWGLRLTWNEQAARASAEKTHHSRGDTGGAAYLARKRELRDVGRVQFAAARTEATRVFKDLSKHATDAVRRTSTERAAPGSRLLLDAAFLVAVKRSAGFKTALRRTLRGIEASGLSMSLTGPWPAYNFIT
jgi:hypothetical protein